MTSLQLVKARDFLTCIVCAGHYVDPCTLSCQHSFCRSCISIYLKTKPECILSQSIPCPSCRKLTKVPDPSRPVDEWAGQILPSIVLLGLLDSSSHEQADTDSRKCCNVCIRLGESTYASFYCADCDDALCDRCAVIHRAIQSSRDHDVCTISGMTWGRKRKRIMCKEHEKNCIEFHCRDCETSACQTCCIIHHRACQSVVTIESMKREMAETLTQRKDDMAVRLDKLSSRVKYERYSAAKASENKMEVKCQIRAVGQTAIDAIKEKEKLLMEKLEKLTEKQSRQLHADINVGEINIQTYRQYCEFIDQAVTSNSVIDMYVISRSDLVMQEIENCEVSMTPIEEIKFSIDAEKLKVGLEELSLGEIDVSQHKALVPLSSTDVRTAEDDKHPDIVDITVLDGDHEQIVIVTDDANRCLKAFTHRQKSSFNLGYKRLVMSNSPWGITKIRNKKVLVSVPDSQELVTVQVLPEFAQVSKIATKKKYYSLADIDNSFIAAGSWDPDNCVDLLDMFGHVMKSVSNHNNETLFLTPTVMCVNRGGLFVTLNSDSVYCLTSTGDIKWHYTPSGDLELRNPWGITTVPDGDLLVADKDTNKVIQLTQKGKYVKDALTKWDGVSDPRGIYCDRQGRLFICDALAIKVYNVAGK